MKKNSPYRIHIRKEALKFSAAHMTVFADGTKERLHGHNYRVSVSIALRSIQLQDTIPFSVIKECIKSICDRWDEKVLLPLKCPFLKILKKENTDGTSDLISNSSKGVYFEVCGKQYLLPEDEIAWIDADNISSENLAQQFGIILVKELRQSSYEATLRSVIENLDITVEESAGQGASFSTILE